MTAPYGSVVRGTNVAHDEGWPELPVQLTIVRQEGGENTSSFPVHMTPEQARQIAMLLLGIAAIADGTETNGWYLTAVER